MVNYQKGQIYKIINNQNDKIYIGSTANTLTKRWSNHKCDSIMEKCKDRKLYQDMREIGVKNFKIILIHNFPCECKRELEAEECRVMKEMKDRGVELYNDFIGCHSDKTKKKMRESFTDEHKQKLREANTGKNNPNFKGGSISFDKSKNSWRFHWQENKKHRSKSFSLNKYTEQGAIQLCKDLQKTIYPNFVEQQQDL